MALYGKGGRKIILVCQPTFNFWQIPLKEGDLVVIMLFFSGTCSENKKLRDKIWLFSPMRFFCYPLKSQQISALSYPQLSHAFYKNAKSPQKINFPLLYSYCIWHGHMCFHPTCLASALIILPLHNHQRANIWLISGWHHQRWQLRLQYKN